MPGALADAARALAAAPADADDATLLAIVGGTVVPVLGDVVALYAVDPSGTFSLIAAAPGDAPPDRGLGKYTGFPEIEVELGGEVLGGDRLVIRSTDRERRYEAPERLAADLLASLIRGRRTVRDLAARESESRRRVEALALAGRDLAHALNNDLTMPVGVIELLMDRSDFSPDLREMLHAASKDLASLEQHVREFHLLMRAQAAS